MAHGVGKGPGCFRADYPEREWKKVPCTTAPLHPYVPRSRTGPDTVGGGADYAAQMPGTLPITYSEGSFAGAFVGSESDGTANTYSLQLNTNHFSTAACGGESGCVGWQQYVYQNNAGNSTGLLFMQYWLLNYPSNCPAGYTYYPGAADTLAGCYMNSAAVDVPLQAIANLGLLTLSGYAASGGADEAQLYANGSLYSTSGLDGVLDLAVGDAWTSAEFNVVGLDNATEATFSSGTSLVVNTVISNGQSTTPIPNCLSNGGTTAETNNLSLAPVCCPYPASTYGSPYPYIYFQEAYGVTLESACPLPVPNVTVSAGTYTAAGLWKFSFSWPSVAGATSYDMSVNGGSDSITGNASALTIPCGQTDLVTFSSCNASGCGLTETVLKAKNTMSCNTN
jgi:hypothetical protein